VNYRDQNGAEPPEGGHFRSWSRAAVAIVALAIFFFVINRLVHWLWLSLFGS